MRMILGGGTVLVSPMTYNRPRTAGIVSSDTAARSSAMCFSLVTPSFHDTQLKSTSTSPVS